MGFKGVNIIKACFCDDVTWMFQEKKMVNLFANSGDLDQMLHSVAFDLVLHRLPFSI